MKKFIVFPIIVFFIFISGCGYSASDLEAARQEGYSNGYSDGCSDILSDYEDNYSIGYVDGYDSAINDLEETIHEISRDAEFYAMENSDYDTETAMAIVDSFLNNEPDYFGELHTEEEFKEAALTLYKFYEYYYGDHYNVNQYGQ